MEHPVRLIVIAFGLLIAGVVLPFLMVLHLLQSTLPLNLVAVACTIGGITTGFMGITQFRRPDR